MTQPLFASKWFKDVPAVELRQEIQNLYREIARLKDEEPVDLGPIEDSIADLEDSIANLVGLGGTFTPTLGANTADPSVTYSQQQGAWARVGPLVFVSARVDWTAISGGSGAVRIRGLDALPTPDRSFTQILPGRANGVDFTAGRSALYAVFPSAGVLQVASYGSNVGTQTISLSHLGSSGSFIFQGVYLTTDPLP